VGSIWGKSGPPSFAHECGEGCRAVASQSDAEAGLSVSLNELRLGKPSEFLTSEGCRAVAAQPRRRAVSIAKTATSLRTRALQKLPHSRKLPDNR
jgi:hypothetical protein